MDVAIGVVAHNKRGDQAAELMHQVGAVYRSVDNGTRGATGNHRRTWHWLLKHTNTDWLVVLEDDAQPVDGFTQQLNQVLDVAATDVVSLYLGHPDWLSWWPTTKRSLIEAGQQADNQDAHWILTPDIIHGVALAIRTTQVQAMLNHTLDSTQPFDYAIRQWVRDTNQTIGFTWPSVVDHADGPTLIPPEQRHDLRPRTKPRKAWRCGTRNHWTQRHISMA